MMRSLPWLVALPDSVGDPIIGTALLNKIAQHIGEQTGLVVVCAERLVPILGEQRGVSHCFAYGPAAQTAVANAPFEWVIDLWSTETSHHVLQYASGQRRAFRSIEDPMLMQVGEATFPASAFNPALGGRAANPHEPAWALEGALVAKVLGEDLWGWVDDGVEPRLHYRMPHEKFACRAAIHRPYAVLLPCGHPSKHWPMASYLKLGGRLSQLGFEVHLSLGPNESSGSAKDMWAAGDFVFHGPMNLRGLAAVLSGASLVVANDCGPMHIACASGTPTVGIFGPSNPKCWFCYGGNHRRWIRSGPEPDPWAGWDNGSPWQDWPSVDEVYALALQVINSEKLSS